MPSEVEIHLFDSFQQGFWLKRKLIEQINEYTQSLEMLQFVSLLRVVVRVRASNDFM